MQLLWRFYIPHFIQNSISGYLAYVLQILLFFWVYLAYVLLTIGNNKPKTAENNLNYAGMLFQELHISQILL